MRGLLLPVGAGHAPVAGLAVDLASGFMRGKLRRKLLSGVFGVWEFGLAMSDLDGYKGRVGWIMTTAFSSVTYA